MIADSFVREIAAHAQKSVQASERVAFVHPRQEPDHVYYIVDSEGKYERVVGEVPPQEIVVRYSSEVPGAIEYLLSAAGDETQRQLILVSENAISVEFSGMRDTVLCRLLPTNVLSVFQGEVFSQERMLDALKEYGDRFDKGASLRSALGSVSLNRIQGVSAAKSLDKSSYGFDESEEVRSQSGAALTEFEDMILTCNVYDDALVWSPGPESAELRCYLKVTSNGTAAPLFQICINEDDLAEARKAELDFIADRLRQTTNAVVALGG